VNKFLLSFTLVTTCSAYAEKARTIYVSTEETVTVPISYSGTVISFPAPPSKVVLGSPADFSVTSVESDIILRPKTKSSRSALFAYVFGRRFSLIATTAKSAPNLIIIRDSAEKPLKGAKK